MNDIAIRVEDLHKQFRIGRRARYQTFRETITDLATMPLRWGQREVYQEAGNVFWALSGVSFEVKRGEVVGVIGRNGAGKSTLLKVLSRITEPTQGRVEIRGRVGSLLEVGTGFHPELTGRENVYLNGAILGMRRAEIESKFDEIVAFAEIEKFLDTPVKRYSSGMYTRLAFAVAAHLEPEIMIVDEVLAVGDAGFQRKCLGKMKDVAGQGRTVLFVSHQMGAINALCDRVIQLTAGQVRRDGPAAQITAAYLADMAERAHVDLSARKDRTGAGWIRLMEVRYENAEGLRIEKAMTGQPLGVVLSYEATKKTNNAVFQLSVYNDAGVLLFHCNNRLTGLRIACSTGRAEVKCVIPKLPLPPGTYRLNLAVVDGQGAAIDHVEAAAQLDVIDGDFFPAGQPPGSHSGVLLVAHRWES